MTSAWPLSAARSSGVQRRPFLYDSIYYIMQLYASLDKAINGMILLHCIHIWNFVTYLICFTCLLLCIHLCSFIDQEICHRSPSLTGCQVEGCVAILILISDGRGILADQEANNTSMQFEGVVQWLVASSVTNSTIHQTHSTLPLLAAKWSGVLFSSFLKCKCSTFKMCPSCLVKHVTSSYRLDWII